MRCSTALVFLLLALTACSSSPPPAEVPVGTFVEWTMMQGQMAVLPEGLEVYSGRDTTLPLQAFYVRIPAGRGFRTHVVMSDAAEDNRESTSDFAAPDSICVAANAGYFTMDKTPAGHVGLLQIDGVLVEPATQAVSREGTRFEVARAAFGVKPDGTFALGWVTTRGNTLFAVEPPPAHAPGQPAPLDLTGADQWAVEDAVGPGPMLVRDGVKRVTSDEEVFFGTSIPDVHPRTAVGVTATGDLLLMVVDGRQRTSRGVNLDELAQMMLEVGAVDALNLDGGGSSTLVVGDTRLNMPTGGTYEREVMSAIVVTCPN